MYQILCDDYIIHDLRVEELKVINAKCELEVNKTGSLTFQIHPLHPYYDVFKKHISQITLLQDEEVLFRGRVLNDDITFEKIKTVECEGELSYLLDSVQRPKTYTSISIRSYLANLISNHNSQQVDGKKRFALGNVTVTGDGLTVKSNYENTLSLINNKLINVYGGYIVVRHLNGVRYIDYLSEINSQCNQIIQFGKNIVDMKTTLKGEKIYTALIAIGNNIDLTSINDDTYEGFVKQDDYIYSPEAVEKYGWIWKYTKFSSIKDDDKDLLLKTAISELKTAINVQFTINLTAIDLHLLDINIDRIKVGDSIRVISLPHDIDTMMMVKSMSINLDDPSKTSIKLVLPEQSRYIQNEGLSDDISNNKNQTDKKINDTDSNIRQTISNNDANIRKWVSDNFTPLTSSDGGTVDLSDYAKNADVDTKINDLKNWTDNNYVPRNSTSDLSAYAKIVDVNNAFNELATALEGV